MPRTDPRPLVSRHDPPLVNVPGGVIVIFRVVERPLFKEIRFIRQRRRNISTLKKEFELKVGDAADRSPSKKAGARSRSIIRRKATAKSTLRSGGQQAGRPRPIYLISEGPKQKILWVRFVGNTIVSGARLQLQIKSRHPYFWLFKGEVDRKLIDEDVEAADRILPRLGVLPRPRRPRDGVQRQAELAHADLRHRRRTAL